MNTPVIFLITPTFSDYKNWYQTATQTLLKDYPDHIYVHMSIGAAVYSYHPSHIFFHPDLQDHFYTPDEEAWIHESLALRVGPDTKVEWLNLTTSYNTWDCTYLKQEALENYQAYQNKKATS